MSKGVSKFMQWAALAVIVVFGAGAVAAQERVYTANTGASTASVIDPATNMVVDTASLPAAFDLAPHPDGRRVYVAAGASVEVVDTAVNIVVESTPVANGAASIVVHPNGKYAYTVSGITGSYLTALSTGFFTDVLKEVPMGAIPWDIAISPDGRLLYITLILNNAVRVASASNLRILGDIPVSAFPEFVAAHPDNSRVYVAHLSTDTLSVINFAAGTITSYAVPSPAGIAFSPDGSRVYVSNAVNDTVTVLDGATNAIVATVAVGTNPQGLAVSADGAFVYVANANSDDISVISTATNTVTATIPVGVGPTRVAYAVRRGPGSKSDCMNGGWQSFTNPAFKTQGDCIAFYNSIH